MIRARIATRRRLSSWVNKAAAPLALLAACTDDSGPRWQLRLEAADLVGRASLILADSAGPALADVRAVSNVGDTIVVVDALEPFFRVYTEDGRFLGQFANKGRGPQEIERLGHTLVNGNEFWIGDWATGETKVWDVSLGQEITRTSSPGNPLAYVRACGAVHAVHEGLDAQDSVLYGLKRWNGAEWAEVLELRPKGTAFTPTWPDFDAVSVGPGIVLYDWFDSDLVLIGCDASLRKRVDVPYPENWRLSPKPTGLVALGDTVVLFYSDRADRVDDHTLVAVWHPTWDRVQWGDLPGDWRLQGADPAWVWVVDNRVVPKVMGIAPEEFLEWLEKG